MFSVRNKQNEERFYDSISTAKWRLNGAEVCLKRGFQMVQSGQENPLDDIFRKESDISYRTCSYVNEFYKNRFMTFEKGGYFLKNFMQTDTIPEGIKQEYPMAMLKTIPKDLFWLEVQLSQPVAPEIISDLAISMNCFPVINRRMNEFSQLLTRGANIIPLSTDELFLDVIKITDTKNNLYKALNSFNSETDDEGYIIRQGGIARFDSRDAKETIIHLIDLLRDERSRYAILGTDVISSELKQLDQIISRLQQRLETSNVSDDSNSYVLLNCKSNYERINVQFWSTSGDLANNIKADSKLTIYRGSDLDSNSVVLCTNTFGGRQKLTREDKMNKLRRALLSKGRIVTREDVKALCFEYFGPELVQVEIKYGVQLDNSPVKGMVKTLDIYLVLVKHHKLTEDDLQQKTDGLITRLKQESINLLPFRVFTKGN
jgi:hypothetical protein